VIDTALEPDHDLPEEPPLYAESSALLQSRSLLLVVAEPLLG
jgi:hypothetical protein